MEQWQELYSSFLISVMWSCEFYEDKQGNEPVKDFLLSLDKKSSKKILSRDLKIVKERLVDDLSKKRR